MTVTIQDVREKLRDEAKTATGLTNGYAYRPRSYAGLRLPLLVVLSGPATYDRIQFGSESFTERRTLTIRVYAAEATQGSEGFAEAEMNLDTYLYNLQTRFGEYPRLTMGDGTAVDVEMAGDGGAVTVTEQGTPYVAADFRVTVETTRIINHKT